MRPFTCRSCGDRVFSVTLPADVGPITKEHRSLFREHCHECAMELAFGQIKKASTSAHSAGGGRRVIHSSKSFS